MAPISLSFLDVNDAYKWNSAAYSVIVVSCNCNLFIKFTHEQKMNKKSLENKIINDSIYLAVL